jgi:hypothetical protein
MINLSLDLLNRIIESKIHIYDDISYNEEYELYDFLQKYKYDADYKLIYLILDNREIVYKYIYNEFKIQYKLLLIEKSKFNIGGYREITLDIEYYNFDSDEEKKLKIIKDEVSRIIYSNTNLSYSILYLLRFKNGIHYKFGISNNLNLYRLKILNDIYEIDFNKSFIYYGLKRDIHLVENYIKKIIPEIHNNPYQGMNGFSEIRGMETFKKVFKKCENQFLKDFSLIKYELRKLNKDWDKDIKKIKLIENEIDIPEIDIFNF